MITIYKAPDEFVVKLYQWSCADFRREIEEGFPLLRGVENRTSYGLVGLMESLPKDKQFAFASFLLQRFHQRAIEILGEKRVTIEQPILEQWNQIFQVINHREQERLQRERTLGPLLKGKEKAAIVRRVRQELHEPYCVWPRTGFYSGMSFEVVKGGFRIVTRLAPDFKGVKFYYEHSIQNKEMEYYDKNMTFYCDRLSLYTWLGISQLTTWTNLRAGDIEPVVSHIVRLCRHFIEGVGSLLDDSYLSA
ncbi:MAG TPA: hypothetical protein VH592_01795 [Gemmataceae bacterium]|jgi:hypothetical protein